MNCELDTVAEQLSHQLNDIISCMQAQERTLDNEKKDFQKLHDLYYDIRHAKVSNETSLDPSNKIKKELKAIYSYLMLTIKRMHDRQKKRLLHIYNKQMTEELRHPQIDTPQKVKLKAYFSRTTLFIQYIEILLI